MARTRCCIYHEKPPWYAGEQCLAKKMEDIYLLTNLYGVPCLIFWFKSTSVIQVSIPDPLAESVDRKVVS